MAGIRYICHFCGHEGDDPDETSIDRVMCEVCGEPVMDTN